MLVREAFIIELHLGPAFHVRDGNRGSARSLAQKLRVRMVCSPQHPVHHHIRSSTSKVPLWALHRSPSRATFITLATTVPPRIAVLTSDLLFLSLGWIWATKDELNILWPSLKASSLCPIWFCHFSLPPTVFLPLLAAFVTHPPPVTLFSHPLLV